MLRDGPAVAPAFVGEYVLLGSNKPFVLENKSTQPFIKYLPWKTKTQPLT